MPKRKDDTMKKNNKISKMVLAAFFLALSYVMPFLTGQIPEFGSMLCPMHFPVLLCGFICGWKWGLAVGFIAPLFRSFTLGMPPLFPVAVCMTFELAVYGLVAGLLRPALKNRKGGVYTSLICAMISGRVIWGLAMFLCMGITGGSFGINAFIAGAVTNAIPGIILQILIIPIIVMAVEKNKKHI